MDACQKEKLKEEEEREWREATEGGKSVHHSTKVLKMVEKRKIQSRGKWEWTVAGREEG